MSTGKSRAAAFFDMDLTLLRVNSGTLWLRHLVSRREVTLTQLGRALLWLLQYRLALVDGDIVTAEVASTVAGQSEAGLREKCDRWFADKVAGHVSPAAREAVEQHRRSGHLLAVLSGSSLYASEPLARLLDIPHVLCTRLEIEAGHFTGRVLPPACFGPGKVAQAEEFSRAHGVDLDESWFYSDSYSDLPMLLRVGHPVVVNPDIRLRRHARRAGWPTLDWRI